MIKIRLKDGYVIVRVSLEILEIEEYTKEMAAEDDYLMGGVVLDLND